MSGALCCENTSITESGYTVKKYKASSAIVEVAFITTMRKPFGRNIPCLTLSAVTDGPWGSFELLPMTPASDIPAMLLVNGAGPVEVVTSPPVKSTCGSAAKFEPTRTLPMKVELGAMSWSSNAVASSVRSSCCLCSVSLSWQMAAWTWRR